MIFHRFAGDGRHLYQTAVIHAFERPKNAALHWFQTVFDIRNGAVANDIRGILKKISVHPLVQLRFELAGRKRTMHNFSGHIFSLNVTFAIDGWWRISRSIPGRASDWKLRLFWFVFTVRGHDD